MVIGMTGEVGVLMTGEIGGPGAAMLAPFEIPSGIVLGVGKLSGRRICLHPRRQDMPRLLIGTGARVVLAVCVGQVGLQGGD